MQWGMYCDRGMRTLSEGLAKTFELLGRTENKAAVRVLVPALDSSNARIAKDALRAILRRPGRLGKTAILDRLDKMPESWKRILEDNSARLSATLRDAVLGDDEEQFARALRAAVWLRQYELIPTLLNVLEEADKSQADSTGKALMELVESLYEELCGIGGTGDQRDPKLMHKHVVEGLERSVKRFSKHRRREVLETFLMLAKPVNKTLKEVLGDPHHFTFLATVDILATSPRQGIMRLLLGFLDDPHPPPAALSTISKREDVEFLSHFLHKVARLVPGAAVRNVKRIRSVAWLKGFDTFLDKLDAEAQCGAVAIMMQSEIPRLRSFDLVVRVLEKGKIEGRRVAAGALAEFPGSEANAAAMKALDDEDGEVRANIIGHIRRRGIPGILPLLVKMAGSNSKIVRDAARAQLPEFTFERYVASFDMLDDEVRGRTGALVRKIDPRAADLLREEMRSPIRSRRMKSIAVAEAMGMTGALEEPLIELASDSDHMVRMDAVTALGQCAGWMSRQVLENSLSDRSIPVRDAAKRALFQRDLKDLSVGDLGKVNSAGEPGSQAPPNSGGTRQ